MFSKVSISFKEWQALFIVQYLQEIQCGLLYIIVIKAANFISVTIFLKRQGIKDLPYFIIFFIGYQVCMNLYFGTNQFCFCIYFRFMEYMEVLLLHLFIDFVSETSI